MTDMNLANCVWMDGRTSNKKDTVFGLLTLPLSLRAKKHSHDGVRKGK